MSISCCVCGGDHHALQCERARRYISECMVIRASPPPSPPPPWWDPVSERFMVEITTATPWDSPARTGRRGPPRSAS